MKKQKVLEYLSDVQDADAFELASALSVSYPTAAMALLRLLRQGLVCRYLSEEDGTYWYRLSDKGHARLAYFNRR